MTDQTPFQQRRRPMQMRLVLLLSCALTAMWQSHADATNTNPVPIDAFFVLDNSGSMKEHDPRFITRQVVVDFSQDLSESSRLGMILFDQDARLLEPLTQLRDDAARERFAQSLEHVDFQGQLTNSPAGIERAIYELKTHGREQAEKIIIFVTDGIIDRGDTGRNLEASAWLREGLAGESKQAGIRIFGVAFTGQADVQLIRSLALQTGGEYFRAYHADDIPHVLHEITRIVSSPPGTELDVASAGGPQNYSAEPPYLLWIGLAGLGAMLITGGVMQLLRTRRPALQPLPSGVQATAQWQQAEPPTPGPASVGSSASEVAQLIDIAGATSDAPLPVVPRQGRLRIGRDSTNDIAIPANTISSLHATIELRDDCFFLEDHQSTNGTKLNHQRLSANQAVQLKHGDRVDFADLEFRFIILGRPSTRNTVDLGIPAFAENSPEPG